MGQIAAPLAIAGAVLQVGSGITQAAGESRALAFRAAEAKKAEYAGRTAAAETDATLRAELSDVLANIRAIRASAGVRPDSPTTQAILEEETRVSERERRIRVGNINRQADSDADSARYLRRSSRDAFLYGTFGSVARGFSSIASAYPGPAPRA